ncbi:hypothetical protein [Celerinatantimonas sp. YJH-8]|uniref:hypothetical protein n=1 Tax=Celerinatantimonas sp. YJH-8 TaxID=3228714 RepID=UPI0038C76E6D
MIFYIATTFREFDGSANDQIQRLFLERLSSESEVDIKLIVTTFGERNVKKTLDEYMLNYEIFEEEKNNYRFSLTNVLLNAINNSYINPNDFVIWTTCDVIFDHNFFLSIKNHAQMCTKGISIVSHPHLIFSDIQALKDNRYVIHGPNDGIDFLGFSGAALSEDFKRDIKLNFFSDWGVFEHFLVAVAVKNNLKRINLFSETKAKKICNDRLVNNENDKYFQMSLNKNWPVLNDYIKKYSLSKKFKYLVYCNLQYSIPSIINLIVYRIRFTANYASYTKLSIKSFISSKIPYKLKCKIKKVLIK